MKLPLLTIIASFFLGIAASAAKPEIAKESVAVLYNSNFPNSKEVAEYYIKARGIPEENLIGLPMPDPKHVTRTQYEQTIEKPLRKHFTTKGWWKLQKTNDGFTVAVENKIKVLVTVHGVPFRINQDKNLNAPAGKAPNKLFELMQRWNLASVDSELSILSVHDYPPNKVMVNQYFSKDVSFADAKLPFYMLVGRIDSNNPTTCKRMIDDAIATEKQGLWGMCYIDEAHKGGGYELGDKWLNNIEKQNWKHGIPSVVDKYKTNYFTNYPMRDVAMYYGWHTNNAVGPFRDKDFKVKRGAIIFHLHSFSAEFLRRTDRGWTGPLLERGAAATVGNVMEPYLAGNHFFDIMHDRLIQGYSLVEAAYMSAQFMSWQYVVLGDPLYRPFIHIDGKGEVKKEDKIYRTLNVAFKAWGNDEDLLTRKLRGAGAKFSNGKYYETVGLYKRFLGKPEEALLFFSSAKKLSPFRADKARNDFHILDLILDAKEEKRALMYLQKLNVMLKDTPELQTVKSHLNRLAPPRPPKATPPKTP